jgi:putative cell wall-binding protein/Tol biopolymer transport system component
MMGNGGSGEASISADGRFVAFTSTATNLVSGVALDGRSSQLFVRDLQSGTTRLVTADFIAMVGADGDSFAPAISADGRKIAFQSTAKNLPASTNPSGTSQIYLADVSGGTSPSIRRTSIHDASISATPGFPAEASTAPSISADGRLVTFLTNAPSLTPVIVPPGVTQGYVHDMVTGSTRLLTTSASGDAGGDRHTSSLTISGDGSQVAFASTSTNLTDELIPDRSIYQVFVRDVAGETASELVSGSAHDSEPGNKDSTEPSISNDGTVVAFQSSATNISRSFLDGGHHVFVRDIMRRSTTLVSGDEADPRYGQTGTTTSPSISGSGGLVVFSSDLRNLIAPPITTRHSLVYAYQIPRPRVDRIGGADRYAVSAGVSADAFARGVPVVYVASGTVFADALSGSAAAARAGGPVLLVSRDSIPDTVVQQLARLKPGRIVILGGTASVSAGVESALSAFAPILSRTTGADRYEVSAAVSSTTFLRNTEVAYVASGQVFPDALSGSAAAGLLKGPILLTTKDSIPGAVQRELDRLSPKKIVVLGGTATISESVAATLNSIAPLSRIGGSDRYDVSASVSRSSFAPNLATVYVASGAVFPDALAGSAAAGADGAPVLLIAQDRVPVAVATELSRLKPRRIVILGGTNTLAEAVRIELETYLAP